MARSDLGGGSPWGSIRTALVIIGLCGSAGPALAVSNGLKDAPPGLVELQYKNGGDWNAAHECGGSLIGRHWVVTAAHCIHDARPGWDVTTEVRVRIGVEALNERADSASRIVWADDPGYTPGSDAAHPPSNDIALLRIEPGADLDSDDVSLVRLPDPIDPDEIDDRKGQRAWVSGWGQTSQAAGTMAVEANSNQMEIISNQSCEDQLNQVLEDNGANGDIEIPQGMFCAQDPRDKAVEHAGGIDVLGIKKDWISTGHCEGDSGGPLTRDAENGDDILIGVVSWGLTKKSAGIGCGDGLPNVFANVPMWVNWIKSRQQAYLEARPAAAQEDAEEAEEDDAPDR